LIYLFTYICQYSFESKGLFSYHSAPIRKSRRGLKAKEKERSSDLRDQRERIHAKQLWKRRETHGAGAEEVAFVLAKLI